MIPTVIAALSLLAVAWLYLTLALDGSTSPGVTLCRYIRSLTTTTDPGALSLAASDPDDKNDAGADNTRRRGTFTALDRDSATVTWLDGLIVTIERYPTARVTVDGVALPTSTLDRIAIRQTLRYLSHAQRRADRATARAIVAGI